MPSLIDDDNHEYHFSDSYSQIYIEDVNYNYSVWLTKQDKQMYRAVERILDATLPEGGS